MDDLLFAFMGLDGKYVRATKVAQPDGGMRVSYRLHTQAHPALKELSTRMLALWQASHPPRCDCSNLALRSMMHLNDLLLIATSPGDLECI